MSNLKTIEDFVAAWSRLDAEELSEYFADDGVYHNIPIQPVAGKTSVKGFIENFIATWTATDWEILNITEADGVVFCERIDRTKTTQGDVDLPCFGVFEMENSKIKVWRDYFDLATFTQAMQK